MLRTRIGRMLHAAAARGPYLSSDVDPYVPLGATADDYAQTLWIASLEWDDGHLELKSEGFLNHCETPLRRDGLGSYSYYTTLKYKFLPGWFGALRYDTLLFEEIEVDGKSVPWDDNVQRVEFGLGYHMTHELLVKTVGQISDAGSGWRNLLPAMQFSYRF